MSKMRDCVLDTGMKLKWNYKTQEFIRVDDEIKSDELALLCIPDTDFAKSAYAVFRRNGFDESNSVTKVLSLYFFKGIKK